MNVHMPKEILEGIHIFHDGLTLEVHCICLDAIKECRGEPGRRVDLVCPKVLGHDGGYSTIVWAYVHE